MKYIRVHQKIPFVFDVLPSFELLLLLFIPPAGRMGRTPNVCDGSIVALGERAKKRKFDPKLYYFHNSFSIAR